MARPLSVSKRSGALVALRVQCSALEARHSIRAADTASTAKGQEWAVLVICDQCRSLAQRTKKSPSHEGPYVGEKPLVSALCGHRIAVCLGGLRRGRAKRLHRRRAASRP